MVERIAPSESPVGHWYLVQTKPAAERIARDNLLRQGYEIYLPCVARAVRMCGGWRERVAALFPRYLFMRVLEGRQSLGPARSSVGVAGIVRFGTRYAVVPEGIVEDLRNREDPATHLHRIARRSHWTPGEPVDIRSGPFDGLRGIFEREAGTERIVILLRLLGQEVSVGVPAHCVVPGHAA